MVCLSSLLSADWVGVLLGIKSRSLDSANPDPVPGSLPHKKRGSIPQPHSSDVVELLLEWWPERLLCPWLDDAWRGIFRTLRPASSAGRPWTIPLRASMPPLTEKFRQTIKARMAAFSWASVPDSYVRSVWYSRPLTRTRHV